MAAKSEQWSRVEAILLEALEHEPAARPAFLDSVCNGDEELRGEVESLLALDEQVNEFIESPAMVLAGDLIEQAGSHEEGRRLGPYELTREIDEGGIGAVYLATRADDQYRKQVAIKLIKRGLDTEDMRRRFRHERQILASLDHPNIARLIDGGTTEDGRPYLVMDYVEGAPITKYCDAQPLSIRQRLEMFRTVCSAIHYAHQNLVIHRDIKPGNVLVTADGTPKLLDFGIAKLLDPELHEKSEHTVTSLGVMTPEYASPEQVRGEQVTTASDVYSLGVLLYELLSGQRPYHIKSRRPDQIARVICEQEPTKPSEAVKLATKGRHVTATGCSAVDFSASPHLRFSVKELRGDLDNIILMAMRKEPQRRYASVEQLSEDIRRHLEGLPVIARKDTFGYRTGKFVGRHRVSVAAAAVVVLIFLAGLVGIAWEARAARKERDAARLEQAKAERINTLMQDLLGFANPGWSSAAMQKDHEVTVKEVLDEAANRMETELADQPEVRAAMQRSIGSTYIYQSRFDEADHHLHAALDTYLRLYGEQSPDTAQTLMWLGISRVSRGDLAGAEPFVQRAVDIYRKEDAAGKVEARWYASACTSYGQVLYGKGDLKTAAELYTESLKLSPRLFGSERAVYAITLSSFGTLRFVGEGKLDEAENLVRQALKEFRALPGRTRWEMGPTLTQLGSVLSTQGRYAEAEDALREGLDVERVVWSDNSQYVALNLFEQSFVLYHLGDYAKAEETVARSLEIYKKLYPEPNASYAGPLIVMGRVMAKTGRARKGELLLRQALDLRTRLLPAKSLPIVLAKAVLGECLMTQRRFAEAEPLLLEGHNKLRTLDEGDIRRIEVRDLVLHLYQAWGRPAEAARYR